MSLRQRVESHTNAHRNAERCMYKLWPALFKHAAINLPCIAELDYLWGLAFPEYLPLICFVNREFVIDMVRASHEFQHIYTFINCCLWLLVEISHKQTPLFNYFFIIYYIICDWSILKITNGGSKHNMLLSIV